MKDFGASVIPPDLQQFKGDIAKDVIFTIITCGIYGFFWQYRQMKFVNTLSGEEKFSFVKWLIFSIITCWLYHIYHEYVMGREIVILQEKFGLPKSDDLPAISIILCILGYWVFIAVGIITDAVQQKEINMIVDKISGSQSPAQT